MNTAVTVVGLAIGVMILGAGLYFFAKHKSDAESRKIYGITAAVGALIVLGLIIRVWIAGW